MSADATYTAGFSGDLGWNESEEAPRRGLNTALLALASGAVWSSLWLLSGFPPLSSAANCVTPQIHAEHEFPNQPRRRRKSA